MNILYASAILELCFITLLSRKQIAVKGVILPPSFLYNFEESAKKEPTSAELRSKQEAEKEWRLEKERRKVREEAWRVESTKEEAIRKQKIQEKKDAQDKIWGTAPTATTCTVGRTSVTTCKQREQCSKMYETQDLAKADYSLLVQVVDKEREKPGRWFKQHLHGHEKRSHIMQQARTNEYMNLINGSQGYCVFDDPWSVPETKYERKYVVLPSCVQKKRGAECNKCCSSSFVVDPVSGVHDGEEYQDSDGPAGCQCRFYWYTNY